VRKRYILFGVGALLLGLFLFVAVERPAHLSPQNSREIRAVLSEDQVSPLINPDPQSMLAMTAMSPVEPPVISLISGGEETDFEWTSRTPAAKRVRRTFPDPQLLTAEPVLEKGDTIELALFDNAVFSAKIRRVTRYPNGAVGMTAHLQGDESGVVYLSYSGGELRASVEVHGADDYYVRYDSATESHYTIQVDHEKSDYQRCNTTLIPSVTRAEARALAEEPIPQLRDENPPVAQAAPPSDLPDGTMVIDLMVVYTPAARVTEVMFLYLLLFLLGMMI